LSHTSAFGIKDLVPACGIIDGGRQGLYYHNHTSGTPPEVADGYRNSCQVGERQCYNCTEKFSREHLKIYPVKGIYLLPIDDTKELLAPDRDEPRISLNAITGILPVATMCLAICINPATVTVLVDSGSTHSFISEMTVRWLHLHPTPRQASMSQSPMVTG
jgi:hypothetical protein